MITAEGTAQDTAPISTIQQAGGERGNKNGEKKSHGDRRTALAALGLAGMMVVLFWSGFSSQVRPPLSGQWGDVYRYQCFAVAFWQGPQAMKTVDAVRRGQCTDVQQAYDLDSAQVRSSRRLHGLGVWIADHVDMSGRFHSLPIEYPVLALVPFSLPLVVPPADYTVAFGIEMTLVALGLFALLVRRAGWRAAGFFAVCMSIGAYATGIERFDLVPAGLTLVALLLAERKQWTWAYLALAAGTFLKYYPIVLVLPLFVAQLRSTEAPMRERVRALVRALVRPVAACAAACAGLLLLSLLINPVIFYRQIATLMQRPLEVESVPATLVWLGSHAGFPMRSFDGFGSDNVDSAVTPVAALVVGLIALLALITAISGLWFRRSTLPQTWLAVLMAITIAGKVFSAQYLIWLLPIAALVVPVEGLAPLSWLAACTLTTFSFPFLWRALHGGWHGVIALRNASILVLLANLLPLEEWARWRQAAWATVVERHKRPAGRAGVQWAAQGPSQSTLSELSDT
jgi:hypothetical protein